MTVGTEMDGSALSIATKIVELLPSSDDVTPEMAASIVLLSEILSELNVDVEDVSINSLFPMLEGTFEMKGKEFNFKSSPIGVVIW